MEKALLEPVVVELPLVSPGVEQATYTTQIPSIRSELSEFAILGTEENELKDCISDIRSHSEFRG